MTRTAVMGLVAAVLAACGGAHAPPARVPEPSADRTSPSAVEPRAAREGERAHEHEHELGAHEHGGHGYEHEDDGPEHGGHGPAHGDAADAVGEPVHGGPTHAEGEHAHGRPIGHTFADAAAWSARFDDPKRDAWQRPERVLALMQLRPGMTVADIGAGTGYFAARLARTVAPDGRVLALDIEPDMVRFLGERAQREGLATLEPRQVRVDDPQLPAAGVDRVLIVNTWHHIPARDAYAAKLHAALTPGGAVYIVDYRPNARRGPPRRHRLAPDVVVRELEAGGLDAAVLDAPLPHQYVVVGRARPVAAPATR